MKSFPPERKPFQPYGGFPEAKILSSCVCFNLWLMMPSQDLWMGDTSSCCRFRTTLPIVWKTQAAVETITSLSLAHLTASVVLVTDFKLEPRCLKVGYGCVETRQCGRISLLDNFMTVLVENTIYLLIV